MCSRLRLFIVMVTVFVLPAVPQFQARQWAGRLRVRTPVWSFWRRSFPVLVQPGRPEGSHSTPEVSAESRCQRHGLVVNALSRLLPVPRFHRSQEEHLQVVILTKDVLISGRSHVCIILPVVLWRVGLFRFGRVSSFCQKSHRRVYLAGFG